MGYSIREKDCFALHGTALVGHRETLALPHIIGHVIVPDTKIERIPRNPEIWQQDIAVNFV